MAWWHNGRASDLRSSGREFDCRPARGCVRRLWASCSHPTASTPTLFFSIYSRQTAYLCPFFLCLYCTIFRHVIITTDHDSVCVWVLWMESPGHRSRARVSTDDNTVSLTSTFNQIKSGLFVVFPAAGVKMPHLVITSLTTIPCGRTYRNANLAHVTHCNLQISTIARRKQLLLLISVSEEHGNQKRKQRETFGSSYHMCNILRR